MPQPSSSAERYKEVSYPKPPPNGSGIPIHPPSNKDRIRPLQRPLTSAQDLQHDRGDDGEVIKVPDFQPDNVIMSPADAEKALRELMSGGMNLEIDSAIEVDVSQEVVEGFNEGIKLLPHQILGRAWMKDREDVTKKRAGGILADDMGWVFFYLSCLSQADAL